LEHVGLSFLLEHEGLLIFILNTGSCLIRRKLHYRHPSSSYPNIQRACSSPEH
jgi:hypothetical protein